MLGLDSKISRKIIHVLSGTGFMLCWPLFGDSVYSRLLACIIPLLNGLRILLLGIGYFQDSLALKSISRTGAFCEDSSELEPRFLKVLFTAMCDAGAREEILRGPFVYVIMLAVMTVAFWRDSPIGIIALSAMCGGDGMADIVGRRLGHLGALPWNKQKSWIGSLAMFITTSILSILLLKFFGAIGTLDSSINLAGILTVSLIATFVESLPIPVDDNISVPTAAAISASVLL